MLTRVLIAVALSSALGWKASHAADPPRVQGLLATAVTFEGEAREKLASAACELLASCGTRRPATETEWSGALRGCHLQVTFAESRTVKLERPSNASSKHDSVEADELIVTFPLASGRVWVRSGREYAWFAKWPGADNTRLCRPIQELLKEAKWAGGP